MILVDTNILIHSADECSAFHSPCKTWLEDQRSKGQPWFTTWPIFYEFLRVMTHRGVLRNPWLSVNALSFIEALLETPGFAVLVASPKHAQFVRTVIEEIPDASGSIMHDLHTVALMREHGIRRIATRDKHFGRFAGLETFDPVTRRA